MSLDRVDRQDMSPEAQDYLTDDPLSAATDAADPTALASRTQGTPVNVRPRLRDSSVLQTLLDNFRVRHGSDPLVDTCTGLPGSPIFHGAFCKNRYGSRRYFVTCKFHLYLHGRERSRGPFPRIDGECPEFHMCHPFKADQNFHRALQPPGYDVWGPPGGYARPTIVCVPFDLLVVPPGTKIPRRYHDQPRDFFVLPQITGSPAIDAIKAEAQQPNIDAPTAAAHAAAARAEGVQSTAVQSPPHSDDESFWDQLPDIVPDFDNFQDSRTDTAARSGLPRHRA